LKPHTPSPAAFEFRTSTFLEAFVPTTWKGNPGATVPMPTVEPLSKRRELPPVVADVNLVRKFVVPLMLADPAGP
jgi:hypothetical protein